MSFYLPEYTECLEIIESNPKMYFYESNFIINSYDLSIFGYRHATYNNFKLPIIDKPNINALELKGLSFTFNDDGSLFRRNLMLSKFWELDQYKHCVLDKFIDKPIKNITEKLDGFLLTFIMLPDGSITSQTKKGFYTKTNVSGNKYLENPKYYKFIESCLLQNKQPIFELIGEKLYVEYDYEDMVLLKLRCNKTGKYLDIKDIDEVPIVNEYSYSLTDILELKKDVENKEGWILHFEDDDTMLKIKTDWWVNEKRNA